MKSLVQLRRVGLEGSNKRSSCSWEMKFLIDGHTYLWGGAIKDTFFLRECIERDGAVLVKRDHSNSSFLFNGAVLPQLKWTESAITLLANEKDLAPLHHSLRCIVSSVDHSQWWWLQYSPLEVQQSLAELQSALDIPLLIRAKTLQDQDADMFYKIRSDFIGIFPYVENIKIVSVQEYFPQTPPIPPNLWTIAIKERNVDEWIKGGLISSGMLRTFKLLLELTLLPKGTLFLIDEFENSLGINCLSQVADIVKGRQGDIQFILTSHHPYVINNIPLSAWKLVTRHGSQVTIRNVSEIPALQTASSLDRFYQLINVPEYQEGIA
ncbi:MAG: AAA family ATPase [Chloroflexi bacterium]|nr:AAA family ATPase [Chloroflexota bacterium]